ncbi:hypothetical protein BS627_16670 [Agrobacterium salinitolerans]|nr:hypothetical protein BS627_16670 [Agrobacterium salinitolerans]PNQ22088.1 hypothetical protein C2E26_16965 [Rhizobium sp. YIC5082]
MALLLECFGYEIRPVWQSGAGYCIRHSVATDLGSLPLPSFLCSSQESSRRASAWREESFQPKDLGWLDSCDEHRNEGGV